MKLTGQLTGIAPGEEIYAAAHGKHWLLCNLPEYRPAVYRGFIRPGKTGNIGELKVTGFSEYLHFWDDTHLLGIGYESDENTGNI